MGNILKYLLIIAIITLVGAKYYQVKKDNHTGLDMMAIHLSPFKPLLHSGSSIGFYSNAIRDSVIDRYSYVLFTLQPAIIKPGKADTMLLMVDKSRPALDFKGYTTLVTNGDSHFIYSLIKKDK